MASALIAVTPVVAVTDTAGAFRAQITNTADTTATGYYFDCRRAITHDTDPGSTNDSAPVAYAFADSTLRDSTTESNIGWFGGYATYHPSSNVVSEPKATSVCRYDPGPAKNVTTFFRTGGTRWIETANQATEISAAEPVRTQEAWLRTTKPGFVMGFGDGSNAGSPWCTTSSSSTKGLAVFVGTAGTVSFATWNGSNTVLSSPRRVDDGQWHHVVAVYNSGAKSLYVDGTLAGTQNGPSQTLKPVRWRLGCDSLEGWPGASTSTGQFDGDLMFAAAYGRVLTATDVQRHYDAGR